MTYLPHLDPDPSEPMAAQQKASEEAETRAEQIRLATRSLDDSDVEFSIAVEHDTEDDVFNVVLKCDRWWESGRKVIDFTRRLIRLGLDAGEIDAALSKPWNWTDVAMASSDKSAAEMLEPSHA